MKYSMRCSVVILLSTASVVKSYKRFPEGREEVGYESRHARSVTWRTKENLLKIYQIGRKTQRLGIRISADIVNTNKEIKYNKSVCKIVPEKTSLSNNNTTGRTFAFDFMDGSQQSQTAHKLFHMLWNMNFAVWQGNKAWVNKMQEPQISSNAKSVNEQIKTEGKAGRFFRYPGCNRDWMGIWELLR